MKLIPEDYLMGTAIGVNLATRMLTEMYISLGVDLCGSLDAALTMEKAPVMKAMLMFTVSNILSVIVMPALIFAFYIVARKVLKHDRLILLGIVGMFLMAFLINFFNDLGVVLGLMLR